MIAIRRWCKEHEITTEKCIVSQLETVVCECLLCLFESYIGLLFYGHAVPAIPRTLLSALASYFQIFNEWEVRHTSQKRKRKVLCQTSTNYYRYR